METVNCNPEKVKPSNLAFWGPGVLAAAVVLLSICTSPISEINDDAGVQWIVGTVGDYSPYQHPCLSALVRWMSFRWPGICWFVVIQYFAMFFALWAMLWTISSFEKKEKTFLGWVVCIAAVWIGGLKYYTFTRTSPILLAAGCMLISTVVLEKQAKIVRIVIGNSLLLLGMMFRYEGVLAVFPFFALLTFYLEDACGLTLLQRGVSAFFRGKWLWVSMAITIAAMAGGRFFMEFVPGWSDYLDFDMARGLIQDYESQDRWGQAEETYTKLGLDKVSYEMILNWNTEDTDIFTTDVLQEVAKERHAPEHIERWVTKVGQTANETKLYVVALAAIVLSLLSGSNAFFATIFGAFGAVALVLFQVFTGRVVPRSLDAVIMGFLFFCMFLFMQSETTSRRKLFLVTKSLSVVMCLLACWEAKGNFVAPSRQYAVVPDRYNAVKTIEADDEHVYFLSCSAGLYLDQACGMWGAIPHGEATNLFWLGDCYMRAPKVREMLSKMGIENPMRALFEDERVYSSNNDLVLRYLNARYGDITCNTVKSLCFFDVVQYSSIN